jgi:hypothetical protein
MSSDRLIIFSWSFTRPNFTVKPPRFVRPVGRVQARFSRAWSQPRACWLGGRRGYMYSTCNVVDQHALRCPQVELRFACDAMQPSASSRKFILRSQKLGNRAIAWNKRRPTCDDSVRRFWGHRPTVWGTKTGQPEFLIFWYQKMGFYFSSYTLFPNSRFSAIRNSDFAFTP